MGNLEAASKAMGLTKLAPHIYGYTSEKGDEIYIPMVVSDEPNKGHMGRFIDSLPKNKTIKFPNIVSATLKGMLERRGFKLTYETFEEFDDEQVDVYVRPRIE